jgi:hypothetical protein
MMGGTGLMDNNSTFIYLGALVAVIGVALIAFGVISKPLIKTTAAV